MSYLSNPGLNIVANSFSKGMFQDYDLRDQPESTYRYALNAVRETISGDMPSLANEQGNRLLTSILDPLNEELILIGARQITESEFILIVTNSTSGNNYIYRLNTVKKTLVDIIQKIDPLAPA